MRRSTKFALAAVATLALATAALPAFAQQAEAHHGGKIAGGMGMMGVMRA